MNPDVAFQVELIQVHQTRQTRPTRKPYKLITVVAAEETQSVRNYFLLDGNRLAPAPGAIRAALPHRLRRAFDRASCWFPLTLLRGLTDQPDPLNSGCWDLYSTRGRFLGSVYATPYRFKPEEPAP